MQMKSRSEVKEERPWGLHQLNTDQKKNPRVGKFVQNTVYVGLEVVLSNRTFIKYCSKSYMQFR